MEKGIMGKMGLLCWEERAERMGIWVVVGIGIGVEVEEMEMVVGWLEGGNQVEGRRVDGGSDGCGGLWWRMREVVWMLRRRERRRRRRRRR